MQKTGVELIAQERQEQLTKHNRSMEEDRTYNGSGELIQGATALLIQDLAYMPLNWDGRIVLKMMDKPYMERLAIAGALIAAELDRINSVGDMETAGGGYVGRREHDHGVMLG